MMTTIELKTIMIEKICPTCNKQFQAKRTSVRFCSKTCAQHHPSVLEKMQSSKQKTYDKKYGGLHPMQTEKTVNNFKDSIFKKYGNDYFTNYLVKKTKETNLKTHGDENYNNVEQIKKTCLERYGVENYVYTDEYKEKSKNTCMEKYGVDHPSKSRSYKISHSENMFEKFSTNERFINFTPKFTLDDYRGVTTKFNEKYPFECKRCKLLELHDISDGKPPRCNNCDVEPFSYFEKEVFEFIKELLGNDVIVIQNDRMTLYPKEIDILIPSLKIGIECDGLYWHSEILGKKNKTYHLNKTRNSIVKEIRLIHIFENEWKFKNEIVKSILKNILIPIKNTIYARKCIVHKPTREEYKNFILKNHIQGMDNPSIIYALKFNDEIVSVMSFCKSRFDRKQQYELSRFCNSLNVNVIGGASRLFKRFIDEYRPNGVVSYSDKRYFSGNLYQTLGFTFEKNTTPNYFYITDSYQNTKSRMSFQKHKLHRILPIFDNTLTEWENMKNNGFDRIWDCGHSKWIVKFNYLSE